MYEKVSSIVSRLPEMDKHILMWILWVSIPEQVQKVAKIASNLSDEEKNKLFEWGESDKMEYSEKKWPEAWEAPDHIMKLKAIMGKLPEDHRALVING